jgi:hypothetical protein
MSLPFTTSEFFEVFRRYNETVWPVQWALYALALVGVALALRGGSMGSRVVAGILALLWSWMGVAYHLAFFRPINPAATLFGVLFVAQAGVFLWTGVRRRELRFRVRRDVAGVLGASMVAYALVVYPLIGYWLGHRYPAAPTFGVPCPTTILTFGLVLWTSPPVPRRVLVVPVLWALIATTAAFEFGVWEDLGLIVFAMAAVTILWSRGRHAATTPATFTA